MSNKTLSDRELSIRFVMSSVALLIHGLAALPGLVLLVGFVPKYSELFCRLRERGELPLATEYVLFWSAHWYWAALVGLVLDIAVLCLLGLWPTRRRWPLIVWSVAVVAAMGVLAVLIIVALLLPIQRMARTI